MAKNIATYSDQIRAWERFLVGEPDAAAALGSAVVSSWRRSLELGVNPTRQAAPLNATGDSFLRLRERNEELIYGSSALLGWLQDLFIDSPCIMLVTDPNGVVLEAVGDRQVLAAGERIHLVAGGQWNEDTIGTNGIGTALATGQPAQVHAAEHFCEGIKGWTCAGAPIRQPGTGKILGVVDISGPPSTYQRGNLALAVATARQIESRLAVRAAWERSRLLEQCLQRLPAAAGAGMLLLDRGGYVIFANGQTEPPYKTGATIPGFHPDDPVERWVDCLPAHLRTGVDVNQIRVDGRTLGALIVMPQKAPPAGPRRLRAAASADPFSGFIGASAPINSLIARARLLAPRRVAVLVQGETGVGKEVLVRAIHAQSGPEAPLVVYNCGAASKELLGADLFGHVRGAFTGALREGKTGRFELADGGILCLDEIGELPLDVQPLLLRVLEDGMVYRVGDATARRVDVRVIAMTNRNLRQDVAAGRFRADLFHRLNVTSIEIPPLRDRTGDVGLLLDYFNQRLATKHAVSARQFAPDALEALESYAWPGNVRELRNLVESLLLAGAEGPVGLNDLSREIIGAADEPEIAIGASTNLDNVERVAIQRTIESAGGNLSEAARRLGIARSTLHRKISREGGI